MMKFLVCLIRELDIGDIGSSSVLRDNCTYVDNGYWIYEGDLEYLHHTGARFVAVSEGYVPTLGDMTKKELIVLCEEEFGVDVYGHVEDSGGIIRFDVGDGVIHGVDIVEDPVLQYKLLSCSIECALRGI